MLVSSGHCFTEVTWITKTRSKKIPKSWGRKRFRVSFKPMWFRNLQLQQGFLNHINQTEEAEGWTLDRMWQRATQLKPDAHTHAFISQEF